MSTERVKRLQKRIESRPELWPDMAGAVAMLATGEEEQKWWALPRLRAVLIADRINEINPRRNAFSEMDMSGDHIWLDAGEGVRYLCGTPSGNWGGSRMVPDIYVLNGREEQTWEIPAREFERHFDTGLDDEHPSIEEIAEAILRAVQRLESGEREADNNDEFPFECIYCAFPGTYDEVTNCGVCGNPVCWKCVDKYKLDASGDGDWACLKDFAAAAQGAST